MPPKKKDTAASRARQQKSTSREAEDDATPGYPSSQEVDLVKMAHDIQESVCYTLLITLIELSDPFSDAQATSNEETKA